MILIEKTISGILFSFNSDSTIGVRVGDFNILKEVTKDNVMNVLLDILLENKIEIDGNNLSILCNEIIDIIDSGLTSDYPSVDVDNGSLHYVGTNLIHKRQEDIYSSKLICKVIKTEEGYINDTYIKMSLMKHGINIDTITFDKFIKSIKEYNTKDTTMIITKENMQDYIDKVPKEIMCTFLNEYFNRRN